MWPERATPYLNAPGGHLAVLLLAPDDGESYSPPKGMEEHAGSRNVTSRPVAPATFPPRSPLPDCAQACSSGLSRGSTSRRTTLSELRQHLAGAHRAHRNQPETKLCSAAMQTFIRFFSSHRSLPFFFLYALLLPSPSAAQPGVPDSGILRFPPRLTALLDTTIIRGERFGGIVVEEELVSGIYPLLTTLFFEVGQDSLPLRYKQFRYPEQRENFTDSTIPGGTLQKYWHILNIIGYRMNRFPETTIAIAGGYSAERGESEELARRRGEAIYRYLRNIWAISSVRMELLPPERPHGDRSDTMLQAELRFARIESQSWHILRPVHIREVRRFAYPDSLRLHIDPMMPPGDIRSYGLHLSRGGEVLRREEFPWPADSAALTLSWNRLTDEMEFSSGEREIVVTVVVNRTDGTGEISPEVRIPVRTVEVERVQCFTNRRIERFTLLLFLRNRKELSAFHERMLREYVADGVRPESVIMVTGHADFGERDEKKKLSGSRAAAVADYLNGRVPAGRVKKVNVRGAGSAEPLYSNDLPEGRCYNRTVQIVIESPRTQE